MKKLLLTLLLLFTLGLAAKATVQTYTVTAVSGGTDATFTLSPADGVSLTAKKNNGSTNPAFNAKGADARIYAKGTATVKCATDQIITKIVFNLSSQGKTRLPAITASTGTIATQAKGDATVTWTGEASEISFTVGDKSIYGSSTSNAGQFCFSTFKVTSESTGNPDDTRESFNFEGFKPYTIPAGDMAKYNPALPEKKPANIVYESSDENIAYADNSGILAGDVAGKATITASWKDDAVFKDGSATFEVTVVEKVNSIAEMLEKAPNKDDKVYVNFPMTVTYVNGKYGYVTDGKGGFTLIYGNNNLADKDNIPAGWTAVNSLYNGLEEYTVDGSLPAITEKGTAYEPRTITLAEVTKDLMNEIVIIKDVNFASATPDRTSDNYAANFNGTNGSTTLQFRTNFPIASVDAGTYNVLAAVGYFNGTAQAYPIEYILPDPVLDGEPEITVKHGTSAGALSVKYTFSVANFVAEKHNVNVEILVDGHDLTFVKVEPQASAAPARANSASTVFTEERKAQHESLKGVATPIVTVRATLNGTELFSKTAEAKDITATGIEDVTVDGSAEAEYYNLQGLRVAQPEAGQLYIKRQGGKAVKVRF